MADEPTDARPEADEDITERVLPAILRRELPVREGELLHPKFEKLGELLLVNADATLIIFGRAYVESLARHAGDATPRLVKRMRVLWRRRTREYRLDIGDDAAKLVCPPDLPDDAILAIRDLDVTAPELRGKELVWDEAAGEWRPSEALPAEPNEATSTD
jgi:hypothetical protein